MPIFKKITRATTLIPQSQAEKAGAAVITHLRKAGHEAYVVGGAVRDRLLGHVPIEADVATSAAPEEVESLFERSNMVGASFGVVIVNLLVCPCW